MSYGIGATVEVIVELCLGRWIRPGERGRVVGRHCSPAGDEVYEVRLKDGKVCTFAPREIDEIEEAPGPVSPLKDTRDV